jgi:hypothetical protein
VSLTEEQIVSQVASLLEKRKREVDSGIVNGTRSLYRLASDLSDLVPFSKRFEMTQMLINLNLSFKLLNIYFEQKIRNSVLRAIDSKDYDIPSSIRSSFKREIHGLDVDDHFDADYIPSLEKMKEDFTTLKDYGEDAATKLISLIIDCSEPIIKEINQKVSKFYEETITALKEKPSLQISLDRTKEFFINLHREIYGWP